MDRLPNIGEKVTLPGTSVFERLVIAWEAGWVVLEGGTRFHSANKWVISKLRICDDNS